MGKCVTGTLAHEDRPHPFSVPDEEMGVNIADCRRMCKRNPFHVFSRICWLAPDEGLPDEFLMDTILDSTNEYISSRREGRTHSVSQTEKEFEASAKEICGRARWYRVHGWVGYLPRYPIAHKLSPFAWTVNVQCRRELLLNRKKTYCPVKW